MNRETPFRWDLDEGLSLGDTIPSSDLDEMRETFDRLHRVFKQSPDGRKLLEDWMSQTVYGMRMELSPSQYQLGFLDGQSHFVKMIWHAINQAEKM